MLSLRFRHRHQGRNLQALRISADHRPFVSNSSSHLSSLLDAVKLRNHRGQSVTPHRESRSNPAFFPFNSDTTARVKTPSAGNSCFPSLLAFESLQSLSPTLCCFEARAQANNGYKKDETFLLFCFLIHIHQRAQTENRNLQTLSYIPATIHTSISPHTSIPTHRHPHTHIGIHTHQRPRTAPSSK